MKVYLSTKFEDVELFKKYEKQLFKKYYTITEDWTKHLKCVPYSNNHSICKRQSELDLSGIDTCDYFIMLYNGKKGSGMFLELGYAIAKNKKIIVVDISGDAENSSMFMHLDCIEILTETQFFNEYL